MENRLQVQKTYKLYIGGQFPRTESGRYQKVLNAKGKFMANACLSSRKDLRNAIEAARKAQLAWSNRPAFNKSQIIYRMAEMLESRKAEFIDLAAQLNGTKTLVEKDINLAIETTVHYAGWADKYQQVFSSVNPVSGSYFNFSVYEPTGVGVFMHASSEFLLSNFLKFTLPIITGGNTIVAVAPTNAAPLVITLAEVLGTSDLPSGVFNILTSDIDELLPHAAAHFDVNTLVSLGASAKQQKIIEEKAAENLKRIFHYNQNEANQPANPYFILNTQEVKTTWHPIDSPIAGANSY